ncbi:MAG: GNAT family N-acetyltransferase [Clostridia bacterium]|nr:GNAT family N-acetyltransferase [Clostridia bacterium]
MKDYEIKQIRLDDYPKCNALWNMKAWPYTDLFIEQIISGNREVFILSVDGEYIAECDLVYDNPEYSTRPGERLYFSRLIVKKEERGRGYGEAISQFMLNLAKDKGFAEIALGVDCDNTAAVNLYKKLGFEIYEEAEDKDGLFYRMEKLL